jgi:hypothetical protein
MDGRFVNLADRRVNQIICFFFELDVITYTLLAYIIYSMFIALICAAIRLQIIVPSWGKWAAVIATIIYTLIIWFLIFTVLIRPPAGKEEQKLYQSWGFRILYAWIEFIHSIILLSVVLGFIFWIRCGMQLFVSLIFFLLLLLAWYLFPLAYRKPVRNLLMLWSKDEDADKLKEGNEQMMRLSSLRSASIVLVKSDIDPEKKVNLATAIARHFEKYISEGISDEFSYNPDELED